MTFTHEFVWTATGQPIVSVYDPSSSGWGRALGIAAGQKTTVFQLGDSNAPDYDWRSVCKPWDVSIVTSWNKVPIYWGIIIGAKYNRAQKEWTVRHVDFRAILARRYTFGTNGYSGDTADNILNLAGFSLAAMIPWIIWAGTQGASSNYGLPIKAETGIPLGSTWGDQSGPYTRTFQDFNFTTVEDGLQEVQTMPNGPDVDLEPKLDAATNWYYISLRVGTPRLTGKTWWFDLDSDTPALTDVNLDIDGVKMRNVSFAIGIGAELLMPVKTARTVTSSVALEGQEQYKGKEDGVEALQAHADADLATYTDATEQWTATMFTGGLRDSQGVIAPNVNAFRMGDILMLHSTGDPLMDDGWSRHELVTLDGDIGDTFSPGFQLIGGA
ncbi:MULTISPECIES: hypothetical protein [unclassified Cryobacterium]|uniref:hypothetical protein n=1 Tax=unclassified Cryobacterium TaxID=2649013 RepID=UPI00106A6956|nr:MULTISPECIES: hypothetical protein [unclassified Cryobacterium]TFC59403.1 hypothetical protein E3O68_00445 [Cryobacterium sp. TMB3-1-2]TFC67199.1 hypothetical protein E3T21_17140 [Cryobacterium sp. TMB3-15]TFC73288.1 hypothetical protein E3T22_16915 [Cryobacterium sp. TMB3-10]TFD46176.1 hypothetical protein E3T58_01550 [Cryobacterium sp. TMB3-12]